MGGLKVPAQPFGVYQAIDWLANKASRLDHKMIAARRIRAFIDEGKADVVVQLGIVGRLTEVLEETQDSDLQMQLVWTLANIAAGKSAHTQLVLRKSLSIFVRLLGSSTDVQLKNDIIWACANIAGDSVHCRDKIIDAGVLKFAIGLVSSEEHLEMKKNCVWLISNIIRFRNPPITIQTLSSILPALKRLLQLKNCEILRNVCWCFKNLADEKEGPIDMLVDAGICAPLVELLGHSTSSVVLCALLACINISSGTVDQAQDLIDQGYIPRLSKLLESSDQSVLKNSCFAISNIAAGSFLQIQTLIDEDIYPKLIKVFNTSQRATQIEVLHAISNTVHSASLQQRLKLEFTCVFEIFYVGVNFKEEEAIKLSLESLLALGEDIDLGTSVVETMKNLQTHKNEEIRSLSRTFIEKYPEIVGEDLREDSF